MSGFKKAKKTNQKVKISFQGASGSGKTYSALRIATSLCEEGKRVAFIDTENAAEVYSPPFDFDVDDDFGAGEKISYHPDRLMEKMEAARKAGCYDVIVVDSMTYFWKEQGGLLSMIDSICAAARAKGQKADSFAAWKTVDPVYRKLMNYIRQYPLHVILCIRAKQAYEKVEGQNGKGSIKKVGVEPEFREGFEFEMDAQFAIDENHVMVPLKHRLGSFLDGKVFRNPGDDVANLLKEWLKDGAAPPDTARIPASEPEPESTTGEAPTEAAQSSLFESLKSDIEKASDPKELTAVAGRAASAKKDALLSPEQLKELNVAYAARSRLLKTEAA